MVTDGSANVVPYGRHYYLPFGSEVPAGLGGQTLGIWPGMGTATDYLTAKYTGAERDTETGFDFLQARYHANVQGRFMSVDPGNAGANLGSPQSWNGYVYALNNPMAYLDPSGLCTVNDQGAYEKDGGSPCPAASSTTMTVSGTSDSVGLVSTNIPAGACLNIILDGVPQQNGCDEGQRIFTVDVTSTPMPPVSKAPVPPTLTPILPDGCHIVDPILGALEFTFKGGPEIEVGPFKFGGSFFHNVTKGTTGAVIEANVAGLFGVEARSESTKFGGGSEGPKYAVMFAGFRYDPKMRQITFEPAKNFTLGLQALIGFDVSFNPDSFNRLALIDDACRARGAK